MFVQLLQKGSEDGGKEGMEVEVASGARSATCGWHPPPDGRTSSGWRSEAEDGREEVEARGSCMVGLARPTSKRGEVAK